MPHDHASAQLVTTFDPAIAPSAETSLGQALAQWNALSEAARAEAVLIVHEIDADRPRVMGRAAITQLAAEPMRVRVP